MILALDQLKNLMVMIRLMVVIKKVITTMSKINLMAIIRLMLEAIILVLLFWHLQLMV